MIDKYMIRFTKEDLNEIVKFEYSPRYTGMLTKWHEDYLKHKKWVQDFKNTKYSSYNDVARWHIAKKYELWLPDWVIESCWGLYELEYRIEDLIKFKYGE